MSEEAYSDLPGLVATAVQSTVKIVRQVKLARDTYAIRVECPELAEQIVPGQFFMVRLPQTNDPLLGRPFALYDVWSDERGRISGVEFAYTVIGKLTSRLCKLQTGDAVEVWGPLGNGFPVPRQGRLIVVAGGIGHTPFLAVAREALGLHQYGLPPRDVSKCPSRLTLCYGVRSAVYLAGLDDFQIAGLTIRLATDDGTRGHHGFVTDLLEQELEKSVAETRVFCCGPVPMMAGSIEITKRFNVPCWVSLETPMACGFGACFSCVTRVKLPEGGWDYCRVCVEGPVFPAERVIL